MCVASAIGLAWLTYSCPTPECAWALGKGPKHRLWYICLGKALDGAVGLHGHRCGHFKFPCRLCQSASFRSLHGVLAPFTLCTS